MVSNSNSYDEWDEAEKRLNHWRMRAQRNQTYQYAASRSNKKNHYLVGIPAISLTALVATLGFASFNSSTNTGISLLIAALGSLATVLSAIQTFLNFGSRSEAHKRAGTRFGNIAREIEAVLAMPRSKRGPIEIVLNNYAEKMNSAASDAPPIEEKLMEGVDKWAFKLKFPNPWDLDNPHRPKSE